MTDSATLLTALLGWVVLGTAVSIIALAVAKSRWKVQTARRAHYQEQLRDVPMAIASGRLPQPPPPDRRGREFAVDLAVRTASRIKGPNRELIREWADEHGFVDEALQELESRKSWHRARAVYRLGWLGGERVEGAVVATLNDDRYDVRDAAARALGRLGSPTALGALLDAVERGAVGIGLASGALLEFPEECDAALAEEAASRSAMGRRMALQAIGLRGRAAPEAVVAGLRDIDPGVQREAALALAKLGDAPPEANLELRRMARDGRPWVRAAAATALGAVVGDGAARTLAEMAGDDDFWVGYRAAEALVALPSGPEHAWAVLMSEGNQVRTVRARKRCLELLERENLIHERLTAALPHGGAALNPLLEGLQRAGSRAWADA